MNEVTVRVERTRSMPTAPEQVYALLADVPDSVSHFPGVVALEPKDGGYVWRLQPVGVGKLTVATVYGCLYECDDSSRSVRWTPMSGVGNARVAGQWRIGADGPHTRLEIENEFTLRMPIPMLLRRMAKPMLAKELERQIDAYLDNLARTFGGDDGRVSLRG